MTERYTLAAVDPMLREVAGKVAARFGQLGANHAQVTGATKATIGSKNDGRVSAAGWQGQAEIS